MYLEFFHLTQAPFSITPDPEFVYLSEKHQESLAHLVYGVTRGGGAGFVQLTGEVGTGKTTISRLFLQKLPEETQAALILNPNITPLELLENIYKEFNLSSEGIENKLNDMIDRLNGFLLEWYQQGKNTVVIIDEAQNIPRDTLEQLRLLTNLETSQQKLLQIVLIGQPELKATMQRRDLRQLAQRISSRFHLQALSSNETHEYIQHRLAVAGRRDVLFPPSMNRVIHKLTKGTPRLINTLCDRSLLAAYVDESQKVAYKHVKQAAKEVLGIKNSVWNGWKTASVAMLVIFLSVCFIYWLLPFEGGNVQSDLIKDGLIDYEAVTIEKPKIEPAASRYSWQAYLQLWHPNSTLNWEKNACPTSSELGMACLRRQGNMNQIERLDTPVLLELHDQKLLLVQSVKGDQWSVLTEDGLQQIHKSEIEKHWFGTYFVLWPLAEELIGDTMSENIASWVKSVATAIENRPFTLEQSQLWVVQFQQKKGLLADGIVGKETQMALALQVFNGPKLKVK